LGFYPKPVLDVTTPAVAKLVHDTKAAQASERAHGAFAQARATTKQVAVVQKGAVQ